MRLAFLYAKPLRETLPVSSNVVSTWGIKGSLKDVETVKNKFHIWKAHEIEVISSQALSTHVIAEVI